jgi:phage internal scaffolding protein
MNTLIINKPFQPSKRKASDIACETGSSRTKQSLKDETNINLIMSKYQKTGVINFANTTPPTYEYASSDDYHTSLNLITTAQSKFNELPSSVRNKFQNDPYKFLDYMHDENKLEDSYLTGLRNRPPVIEDEPLLNTQPSEEIK